MNNDKTVRDHLIALLDGGNAHMSFNDVVANFPLDKINTNPPNVPYTPWHILEHLRITQWDILDFMRNPDYKEMAWPAQYWPAQDAMTDAAGWARTIADFNADFEAICAIATAPQIDLYARIPWGDGQIILREILLVADHNSHHIGEFAILRQVMGTWPPGHS